MNFRAEDTPQYGVPVYAITPVLLHKYVFFARKFILHIGLWVTKKKLVSPSGYAFALPLFQ